MFELFGKAEYSDVKNQTGLGLGLSYCKEVLKKHFNGDIKCES
jgi:signal transduction histidine kinase